MRKDSLTLWLAALLVVAGVVWANWSDSSVDESYEPPPATPSYTRITEPRAGIDTVHANADSHSIPLRRLLEADGYWFRSGPGWFTPDVLTRYDVLIVSNALGTGGLVNRAADAMGLGRFIHLSSSAFTDREITTVDRWVRNGGGLLLIADPGPAAAATAQLARAFGVEMTGWRAEDAPHADSQTGNPAFIRFSRKGGTLSDHAIIEGRSADERIKEVLAFGGQVLRSPPSAAPLLVLSEGARGYCRSCEPEGRPANGLALAVALEHDLGRVVVVGNAAALSAQVLRARDGGVLRIGMTREDADNRQFALNIAHWLTGLI